MKIRAELSYPQAIVRGLGFTLLIFFCLEIWRPYYFLNDDNFVGGLPFFTEMGRNLMEGKSPFVSHFLFGGKYDFLQDATYFNWHPLYLAVSLLTQTPLRFCPLEVMALTHLLMSTAGFITLGWQMQQQEKIKIRSGWIIFLALSYTYSMVVLLLGSGWMSFMANASVLPWLAWALFLPQIERRVLWIILFTVHENLAGHLLGFISNTILLSFFALGLSIRSRSYLPLGSWVSGVVISLLIVSPLLLHAVGGFIKSGRVEGGDVEGVNYGAIPALLFPLSLGFGTLTAHLHFSLQFFWMSYPYLCGMAACAAAWCGWTALHSKEWTFLQKLTVFMALACAVLIIRPWGISELLVHIPILKSMRYPFRELFAFQFFFHLFLLLRPRPRSRVFRLYLPLFSLAIFALPLTVMPPPSLRSYWLDRQLIFSGAAEKYWNHIKPLIHATGGVVPVVDPQLYLHEVSNVPVSLIAAYNFPEYFQVKGAIGYTSTQPQGEGKVEEIPAQMHLFNPDQVPGLLRAHPDVEALLISSVRPLKITLIRANGERVDLTPYAPVLPDPLPPSTEGY